MPGGPSVYVLANMKKAQSPENGTLMRCAHKKLN